MRLSLAQEQTINELASLLYDYLPGQPHPYANQSSSFGGIATSIGLGHFWQGGSKLPAIAKLLRLTLEAQQHRFCPLIEEVVRRGIGYRQKKGQPLTREDVVALNTVVEQLGFRIPELHDPKFLDRLPRTERKTTPAIPDDKRRELADELLRLSSLAPTQRGLAFEEFLKELFAAFRMAPRDAFRLVGEQIDGSFQFQGETYLVEATWRNERVGQEELLSFSGKIGGKARWSRGLHMSYAGYTPDGLEAFARGKPTSIICMDGLDLHEVLNRGLELQALVEQKARRAAETNDAFVSARELFP